MALNNDLLSECLRWQKPIAPAWVVLPTDRGSGGFQENLSVAGDSLLPGQHRDTDHGNT